MEWFLQLVDKVGVPLALFAVTIIIVLLIVRRERNDMSASIQVVREFAVTDHQTLGTLQKDHRKLLYKYGKLGQALMAAEKNLQILHETHQNDREDWERQNRELQARVDNLTEQLEDVQRQLADRDNELKILRKNA